MRLASLSVGFILVSICAHGATDLGLLKEKDLAYQREAAVVKAAGKEAEAAHRAEYHRLYYPRIEELARQKVITEAVKLSALRDAKLAMVDQSLAAEERNAATLEKNIDLASKSCAAGIALSCDQASAAYGKLFKSRASEASLQVRKAEAELEFEQYHFDSLRALAASQAVDSAIVAEEKQILEAKIAAVDFARAQLKLAEQAQLAR